MSNDDTLVGTKALQQSFANAPYVPTQKSLHGIRYDFNDGARIKLPPGNWLVNLIDDASGNVLFTCQSSERLGIER